MKNVLEKLWEKKITLLVYIGLFILGLINIIPVFWTILTSIKFPVDTLTIPPTWIFTPTLKHQLLVWTDLGYQNYFVNSLIVSTVSSALMVGLGSLAAYGFSRLRTTASLAILFFLLGVRMFPQLLLAIPYYLIAQNMGLYDTHLILVLVYNALEISFVIWMLRGFFLAISTDLEGAAMLDGCSEFEAFWKIVLPNVLPGIVATFFLIFLFSINEYMFASILTGSGARTMPPAIAAQFRAGGGGYMEYWNQGAAAATGMIVPTFIILLFIQKPLIRGLTFGMIEDKS